jgi:hypothetical protein
MKGNNPYKQLQKHGDLEASSRNLHPMRLQPAESQHKISAKLLPALAY